MSPSHIATAAAVMALHVSRTARESSCSCCELCVYRVQVVGPPGTGKTDVAVQIISNIYHNFPDQRTLIVTHSNQVCRLNVSFIPPVCDR